MQAYDNTKMRGKMEHEQEQSDDTDLALLHDLKMGSLKLLNDNDMLARLEDFWEKNKLPDGSSIKGNDNILTDGEAHKSLKHNTIFVDNGPVIVAGGDKYFGSINDQDTAILTPAAEAARLDSHFEKIVVPGHSDDYRIEVEGTQIHLYHNDGTNKEIASFTPEDDRIGTMLKFDDGIYSIKLTGLGKYKLYKNIYNTSNSSWAQEAVPTEMPFDNIFGELSIPKDKYTATMFVNDTKAIVTDGMQVYGRHDDNDIVYIASNGLSPVKIDSNVDVISVDIPSTDWTIDTQGTLTKLISGDGEVIAELTLQSDQDGTKIIFNDGKAYFAKLISLGEVSLTPIAQDEQSSTVVQQIDVVNDAVLDSSDGAYKYSFEDALLTGSNLITAEISNLGQDDILSLPDGGSLSVTNSSATDGQLEITYLKDNKIVEITLTGVPLDVDGEIYNQNTLEKYYSIEFA